MSLINDALKKAQMQRSSSQANLAATPGAQPKKKSSVFRIATVIGLCAISLSAISVGTTLFILHNDSSAHAPAPGAAKTKLPAAPAVAPTTVGSNAAITPPVSTTANISASPVTSTPPPVPVASAPASPTTPAVALVAPTASPAVPTVAFTPPPPAKVDPPAPAPAPEVVAPKSSPVDFTKPSPAIQGFVDKLRVAGIRLSTTDSKVIINEHLFRANDQIEASLGLRLTKIEANALTFTDGNGFSYVKHF